MKKKIIREQGHKIDDPAEREYYMRMANDIIQGKSNYATTNETLIETYNFVAGCMLRGNDAQVKNEDGYVKIQEIKKTK